MGLEMQKKLSRLFISSTAVGRVRASWAISYNIQISTENKEDVDERTRCKDIRAAKDILVLGFFFDFMASFSS